MFDDLNHNDFSDPPPSSGGQEQSFVPTKKPLMQKSSWVHDDAVEECSSCKEEFSFIRRRHHCRLCGQIFCDDCTPQRKLLPVEYELSAPQRVCDPCALTVEMQQPQLRETISRAMQANELAEGEHTGKLKRYLNSPFRFDLAAELRKAAWSIRNQTSGIETELQDNRFKFALFKNCSGLAIITSAQGGFIGGIRAGTGLVVARTGEKEWSAPCAVGLFGIGFGALIGAEVTDMVVVLETEASLQSFQSEGQVTLGGEMSLALGPIGRNAKADLRANGSAAAASLSYSHSKGLYGGISVETSFLKIRNDVNRDFYGCEVSSTEILQGHVSPPPAAEVLYDALNDLFEVLQPKDWAASSHASPEEDQSKGRVDHSFSNQPPDDPFRGDAPHSREEDVFEC